MSIDDVIRRSDRPHTRATLAADLRALGLRAGSAVIVHSSLSALGYVVGGPATLIEALSDALAEAGTLVMPAQSSDLTDPASWRFPAVPPDWVDPIREAMPAYDPARTPTRGLGVTAELFRTWPGVARSAHPVCSFSAQGPLARFVLEPHGLDDPFGETSPLARLYRCDAQILLLGVGWASCTALHLAERRAHPSVSPVPAWSPILVDGKRVMAAWCEYPYDTDRFPSVGHALERARLVRIGKVGEAPARLARLRPAIDLAVERLKDPARS